MTNVKVVDMENKGIQINFIDGETQYFDPVSDFIENDDTLSFYVGGYFYEVFKNQIKEVRWYPICEKCGYELKEDDCENCK